MTDDKRSTVIDALDAMCDSIQAENTNADVIPCKVSHVDDSTIVDALMAEKLNVDESPVVQSVSIQDTLSSYIVAAGGSRSKPSVAGGTKLDPSISKANFHSLFSENLCEGVNVSIPKKVVETVSTRFANTLYGYFIGKRLAFPVVEYYVQNNWGKYGLTRITMNSKGFFFFQFKILKGLEDVLENWPWMIYNNPIILKKWSMSTCLCMEELTRIPVWVKIHDVPIQVFSEYGLSIIASQIDKHVMLDSYTSSMCIESRGISSFACCLIEINTEDVLKESLTIGVPLI
ncbi:zinc knuckle CX2CX4HX4C containing protein [Tanacetum coccineum]